MPRPATLTALFFDAMDRYRGRGVMLRARRGPVWSETSYADFTEQVHNASLGLLELGMLPGDRVALLSENRPEWAAIDFAALTAGLIDVPVYPTLPASQTEYILRDSGATVVCLSTKAQLAKIREIRSRLPDLRQVVVFEQLEGDDVIPFTSLLASGREARLRYPDWREQALRVTPEDLATIIYTSGTTGEPKGVMLTHGNIASNVDSVLDLIEVRPGDECLSFLPLSHIFERTGGHYAMCLAGVVINYAKGVETVAVDMVTRRPQIMTSVPRVYEKMFEKLTDAATATPGKARIFRWVCRVADRWTQRRLSGRMVGPFLALQHRLADRLVFGKLREKTGGRIRYFISGGAPLAADIGRFFFAAGLPILEGYGLTETSPVISVNTIEAPRFGSVGRPIRGVEVRIAEDGEILARGPNIMRGYYHNGEATREVLAPDGWFSTGDIGYLDQDGFLHITDRKKDIIVTAGGKNIAPQPIENRLKVSRYIANAVMLGDRRKFPVMLLVPEFERLRTWAAAEGLPAGEDAELVRRPEVRAKLELEAKKHFRDLAQFEVPKKFLVLPEDFSIERGELTPKLSVRRRNVEQNYQEEITALYNESDTRGNSSALSR